jgi:hypothetical protein
MVALCAFLPVLMAGTAYAQTSDTACVTTSGGLTDDATNAPVPTGVVHAKDTKGKEIVVVGQKIPGQVEAAQPRWR